jgi:alkylation response protein AidB-like acyl-CoA dehydrogenase
MPRRIDSYLADLLPEEKFDFYAALRDFSDSEIAPNLLKWEREHRLVPDDCLRKMGELGLFGLPIPIADGGQGGDQTDHVLMGLALGYHSQSVAITPGAAFSLGTRPLWAFGTPAQKREHLGDLAAGRRMFVFGLTEPGRGSDAANPEVTARRAGDRWILNGEKCWSTNAKWASHVIVHAMTSPQNPPGKRTTCFLVPIEQPGVSYQEMSGKKVWEQSSTGSISLADVEVPASALLGELDQGFQVMMSSLNGGRLFIAALALGSLAFALDKCRVYCEERIQFDGKPIGRFQRVQDVLIDMDIALERNLTWLLHLCRQYDQGRLGREQAAKVKVDSSRVASDLLVLAMEICGAVACLDEFGLIRHHNDLFVTRVGEGSNFALKDQIVRPLRER